MASVEVNQMLAVAAAACEDKKAEDIRILALDPADSGLTDYFLICTGTNDRQTVAITDEIEMRLKREFGNYPNSVEGRRQGEWILMDYVDFIVHVFLPEKRAYYGLERLRPSATMLSVSDLNAEIKAAIAAKRNTKATKRSAQTAETAEPAASDTAVKTAARKKATKEAPAAAASEPARKKAGKAAGTKAAKKGLALAAAAAPKSAGKKAARKSASAPAKKSAVKRP